MEPVPRETWESLFKSQGMKNPDPRIQMLDGFNEGWIEFEGKNVGSREGEVALEAGLRALTSRERGGRAPPSRTCGGPALGSPPSHPSHRSPPRRTPLPSDTRTPPRHVSPS